MLTIHEHFGFDNRHQSSLLAQCGVASKRMGVGLDTALAGNGIADGDPRPPLGKTGAHLKILLEAVAQTIQTFGDFLSRMTGQVLGSGIYFDAGNDGRFGKDFDEGRPIFLLLADGLIEEDYTTD